MGNYLIHEGKPRRSGRYPWGSGKDPYQSTGGKGPKTFAKKSKTESETEKEKYKNRGLRSKDRDIRESRKLVKDRIRSMSDDELQKNIQRMRNEATLRDLYESEDTVAQGKKVVNKALKEAAGDSIKAAGTKFITGGINYLLKTSLAGDNFDLKEFGKYVYGASNKPKQPGNQNEGDKTNTPGFNIPTPGNSNKQKPNTIPTSYKENRAKARDERKLIRTNAKADASYNKQQRKNAKLAMEEARRRRRHETFSNFFF